MSVNEFSTNAAWIVGLSILALLCLGWRKTARATPKTPRGRRIGRAGFVVQEAPMPSYRRAPIWRRVWAIGSASFITVLCGTLIAIVATFVISNAVITLTNLLKK
jgi:hypothetical protein